MKKIYSTLLLVVFIINAQAVFAASPLNLTGTITDGVNGTGNTVFIPNANPPPPKVVAYALNDEVSVDTTQTLQASGNAAINDVVNIDGAGQPISLTLLWNTPAASPYGFLNFNSNGTFTYTLYEKSLDILKLQAGKTLEDVFEYAIQGYPDVKAVIHVHIAGNPNAILVRNDEISVDTQTLLKVDGDVTTNDDYGPAGLQSASLSLLTPASSKYGFLSFDSAGKFTYTLYDKADAVLAIKEGETVNDVFTYKVVGPNGIINGTATLTVHIAGNPPKVIAINDEAGVDLVDTKTVTGDVLANDINVLKGSASLTSSSSSQYGHLEFDSNGKFTYTVFQSTKIEVGEVKTDVFTYSVKGPNGSGSGTATLTIRIAGNLDTTKSIIAIDDIATLVIDADSDKPSVTINVLDNDINATSASLTGSPVGQFGYIEGSLSKSGELTYRVNMNNPDVQATLKSGKPLMDTFTYSINGGVSDAKITIYIVTGNVAAASSLKAFDYVETIVAEETATSSTGSGSTGNTTTVTLPGTVKGNLVTYNNTLLGIKDLVTHAEIISSQFGKYGYLKFSSSSNEFEYALNYNVPEIQALRNTDNALQDIFKYRVLTRNGTTAEANIVINIVSRREQVTTDNVEIENNFSSSFATPLNSGAYMRGNLMNSSDRDFYFITSAGNEIIHFELCPQGFNCYNQKAWVMYVFDGDRLTQAMQNQTIELPTWIRDDTGQALAKQSFDHMYLLNEFGVFKDALVGIIDPCYGNKSLVDIGVPTLAPGKTRNYFVAISSPLQRDGGSSTSGGASSATCSGGSIILKKKGASIDVAVGDPSTTTTVTGSISTITTATTKSVTTTEQFIAVYPNSDDQYTLRVSRTGTSPVNTRSSADQAIYDASTGAVTVPTVKIGDINVSAVLQQTKTAKEASSVPVFTIMDFKVLTDVMPTNAYSGTFNPSNNYITLPRVVVAGTNAAFRVVLQLQDNRKLKLLQVTPLN